MNTKTILIGSDHAGYELKNKIKSFLETKGYTLEDMGAHDYVEGDDYPTILAPLALKIAQSDDSVKGIVLGGSGQGEAIICNRFPGVRAAVYYGGDEEIVKLSREHNDSNILSLGARFLTEDEALQAVTLWLDTPFSNGERHKKRIEMLDNIE